MMPPRTETHLDPRVAATTLPEARYATASEGSAETLAQALDRAGEQLEWADGARGPFGGMIPRGAKVLVKPNLVAHENQGPWGMDPLITHPSLIHARSGWWAIGEPGLLTK